MNKCMVIKTSASLIKINHLLNNTTSEKDFKELDFSYIPIYIFTNT